MGRAGLLRLTALLTVFGFLGTACTLGSLFHPGRVELPINGIDSKLASEPPEASDFDQVVTRGDEVLVVTDLSRPDVSNHVVQYSPNAGRTWEDVRFDGSKDPGMPVRYVAAKEGQWLVLGWWNQQAIAFTSPDGRHFTRQAGAAFDCPPAFGGELLGTTAGWVFAGIERPNGNPRAARLHTSADGKTWQHPDALVAGLPDVGGGLRITDAAASGGTAVIVGQDQGKGVEARAFASSDGGNSWQDITPYTAARSYAGTGFRTVQWTGDDFHFTGFAWPREPRQVLNPTGLTGTWKPGSEWAVGLDESWSDAGREFPWTPSIARRPGSGLAIQEAGNPPSATTRVMLRTPGKAWDARPILPEPETGEVRLFGAAAAVGDGFLLATSTTSRSNLRRALMHVTDEGVVSERTPPDFAGQQPRQVSVGSFVTRQGTTSALGLVGSQPVMWSLDGDKKVQDFHPLNPPGRDSLSGLMGGARGLMALGTTRNGSDVSPVIWSRPDGGEWVSSNSVPFASTERSSSTPVDAVLPSSHGFLVAGSYYNGDSTDAGMAKSHDGKTWSQVWTYEFKGMVTEDRAIASLAESASGTVLAGGHVDSGGQRVPVVWASPDTATWRTIRLPLPDGYAAATVVSLTAGPTAVVAVVSATKTGRPQGYFTFYSPDDGATWSAGTGLPPPSEGQRTSQPAVVALGGGFILVTTQGRPRDEKALMLVSSDGREFSPKDLGNAAPEGENLQVSAVGTAGQSVLIAGHTGSVDKRAAFCIAFDVERV